MIMLIALVFIFNFAHIVLPGIALLVIWFISFVVVVNNYRAQWEVQRVTHCPGWRKDQSVGTKDILSITPVDTHWSHVYINSVRLSYLLIYLGLFILCFVTKVANENVLKLCTFGLKPLTLWSLHLHDIYKLFLGKGCLLGKWICARFFEYFSLTAHQTEWMVESIHFNST